MKNLIPQLSFADKIIVCDSYSTDGTTEYLNSCPNVQVVSQEWENNFGKKRQCALDATPDGVWVLRLDSDEMLTTPTIENFRMICNELDEANCDRAMFNIYHMLQDRTHCNNMVGIELRLFVKGDTVWRNKVHEILDGKFPGSSYSFDPIYSIVHLKYLLGNKKKEEYLREGFYDNRTMDSLENGLVVPLPNDVDYDIVNENIFNIKETN
jgi:glycosyltransferase involved in cell wall biosynthesis